MGTGSSPSKSGRAQAHLGDQGELWFAAALPQGWVWQPPRRDFGKDGLIVIRDGTKLHNVEFSVQIKTSNSPTVRNDAVLLKGVLRSSVQYWFASPLPTLIVAIDMPKREAWYAWHLDLFDAPGDLFSSKSATVTLQIPLPNRLDNEGWESIRADLVQHFSALRRALEADIEAPRLLRAVHDITRIVGNLIRIGATTPPDPPLTERESVTLLIEQLEIRDLIETVRGLLDRIVEDCDPHKQITFWLTSFEETAMEAYPRLRSLPPRGQDIPAGIELAIVRKAVLDARPKLVLAAIDLARMITAPTFIH